MTNGPPSTSAGPSTPSTAQPAQRLQALQQQAAAAQAASQPGNIYSFSVHQPYPNWPLHNTGTTYAPSWYALPSHYATPAALKAYKEAQVQTDTPEEVEARINEQEGRPTYRKHWDSVFTKFLKNAGLFQTLRGFEEDMLLVNSEWEKEQIPFALKQFVNDITDLFENEDKEMPLEKPLDIRKLDHIKFTKVSVPQTPTTVTKSISRLLAESRRRNNVSNRSEFLQSIAEKRLRIKESLGEGTLEGSLSKEENETPSAEPEVKMEVDVTEIPSCARADAKAQNRDVQMKFDIAKNEDGPLKRTMKGNKDGQAGPSTASSKPTIYGAMKGMETTQERHPGLATRFTDVETHLAVRYVPAPPQSLFDRIKFLEDHIIHLEREYPPWAALHFNQPSRGWPPPPRLTPIIVPSHLTSATQELAPAKSNNFATGAVPPTSTSKSSGRARGRGKSSLHRAVMEKLEVQKAIGDLAAPSTSEVQASGSGTNGAGR